MELGLKNHNGDGLLGHNSIMVVYMDPLGLWLLIMCGLVFCAFKSVGLGLTLKALNP